MPRDQVGKACSGTQSHGGGGGGKERMWLGATLHTQDQTLGIHFPQWVLDIPGFVLALRSLESGGSDSQS